MGQIGFSVTYHDENQVKNALRQIRRKRIPVKDIKVFVRASENDENFLKIVRPQLLKVALKHGVVGGVVGVTVFLVIWSLIETYFEGVSPFRMLLLTGISGAAVGIFLGVAISVISKESSVPISLIDVRDESVVLDFKVDSELRESIEKILEKSGADNILEN